jgi:hypothetical protein
MRRAVRAPARRTVEAVTLGSTLLGTSRSRLVDDGDALDLDGAAQVLVVESLDLVVMLKGLLARDYTTRALWCAASRG